ncbi:MAG: HD domain-containing protein [Chloroflexi bacterium]|nr:HD domain-containing protein [Chloroflexota bacterium]
MVDVVLAWTDFVLDLSETLSDWPGEVYLVGGAVRDAILRRPIKDLDLVTPDSGLSLARTIANHFRGDFYPLDESRDVGRAIVDTLDGRLILDVSGLRAPDLNGDLADRDFTVNAIAVNLLGDMQVMIDPLHGADDLLKKTLRRCTPASLSNDPARVLRGIRQSVQFGLRIEPETLADLKATASHLDQISVERVRDELVKTLGLSKPVKALRVADAIGALTTIIPELADLHGLAQGAPHVFDAWNHSLAVVEALNDICVTIGSTRSDETAAQFNLGMVAIGLDRFRTRMQQRIEGVITDDRPHRSILLLAALMHDVGKALVESAPNAAGRKGFPGHSAAGAQAALGRLTALRFSNAERKLVTSLVKNHMDGTLWRDDLNPVDIYRFWRELGEDGIDLILLILADYLGTVGHAYDQDIWLRLIENAQTLLEAYFEKPDQLVDPPALVGGDSLMKILKLRPGPIIRDLLEAIREGQVSGTVQSLEDAIQAARTYLNNGHVE